MKIKDIKIIRTGKEDSVEILNLLEGAKGDNLTIEERARYGFVQGAIDEELLEKFQNGLGVFAVRINGEMAAVAFTSKIGITQKGPIVEASRNVLESCRGLSLVDIFQYGPIIVKPEFKGKGLLSHLLVFLCSEIGSDFKKGLAFVEEVNEISLQIHRHYFEKEFGVFLYKDRKYFIFLFNPETLVCKYRNILQIDPTSSEK